MGPEQTAILIVGGTGLLILFIILLIKTAKQGIRIRKEYQDALDALEKSPEDSSLRKNALEAGRKLAEFLRDSKTGVTVFDEIALQNDINMRLGKGTSSAPSSVSDKMISLKKMLDAGAITEEEFHQRKEKLLRDL